MISIARRLPRSVGALAVAASIGSLALGCSARPVPVVERPMPGLRAEPPPDDDADPRWPRGCEAAVLEALAAHPGPAAARAALAAAQADARVAITPAPELRVQAGLPDLADGGRVGLRMPLPSPDEVTSRNALERARVRIAQADLTVARVELAATVRLLHLTARRARAAARRASEAAALADTTRAAIAAQASAGTLPAVALADARLVRAAADADRRRAEAAATRAEAALKRLSGYPAANLSCADPRDAGPRGEGPAENPTVMAVRARADEAAAEVALDAVRRGLALEWVEVAWDAVPDDPDRMLMGFTIRLPSLALAADPVGARRRAAAAERHAAERAAVDVEHDARVSWRVAVERRDALADDPALSDAEALLAKVQKTRGKAPEVLALRRRVIAARAALDDAVFEAEAAAIELRRVSGIE